MPPDLPSAHDLDFTLPQAPPAAAPLQTLSFELDLSKFDALPPAATPALGVDHTSPSMFALFDDPVTPTAPGTLERRETGAGALPPMEAVELIDIELGGEAMPLPSVEVLLPSATDATAEGVLLEGLDSSGEIPSGLEARAEPLPEPPAEEEQVKIVGPLRIGIPLFNIFLNEADELSRRLTTEVAEWAMELHRPVGESAIALAHSLAGSSATVGFSDLSQLARTLEHALMRTEAIGHGTADEGRLFVDTAEEIRRLLHQFAAGFLKEPPAELLHRLADHEVSSARRLEAVTSEIGSGDDVVDIAIDAPVDFMPPAQAHEPAPVVQVIDIPIAAPDSKHGALADSGFGELGAAEFKPFTALPTEAVRAAAAPAHRVEDIDDDIDAVDAVDADLFPIFEEEGQELLPKLESQLRDWARRPSDTSHASACMRTLHTLKGGARLAGAMRLGEMAHRLETAIEDLLREESPSASDIEALHNRSDALSHTFEALRSRDAAAYAEAVAETELAASQMGGLDVVPIDQPSVEVPVVAE